GYPLDVYFLFHCIYDFTNPQKLGLSCRDIERLLHSMLADDAVRPAFQSFGVACDSGLRLKTPPLKIVNQHRRRHRKLKAKPNSSRSGFQPDMSDWKSDLRFCETL
ncbi:MAG: hypothetical protein WC340_15725, partial [Kiritimatiellia bacterium]